MLGGTFLVHTVALGELRESCFIHPFVDVHSALGAFQVPCGFGELVLAWFWLVRLLGQDLLDLLGSGEFLGQGICLHGRLVAEVFNR